MKFDGELKGCSKHGPMSVCGHDNNTCPERSTAERLVSDEKTFFRVPRDGMDLNVLAIQDPIGEKRQIVTRTRLSAELKTLFIEYGVDRVSNEHATYLKINPDDERFSGLIRAFAKNTEYETGIAVVGNNAIPYCEAEGNRYRILTIPEKSFKDIPSELLEAEIDKIFVPSRVQEIEGARYLLMPILDQIDHPDKMTPEERDDFLSRLESTRIVPSLDIGMNANPDTGHPLPETNLARYQNRIYICDAGDLLLGSWDGDNKTQQLELARKALESFVY